jgi:hypothetical protein
MMGEVAFDVVQCLDKMERHILVYKKHIIMKICIFLDLRCVIW